MFNLINILGQNTLPEQVEINKQNIAILADEVEKLGYQPKGVYDAETEYNHNDVVFYDNKLYVVTSDAAIVGVLPTNTTYWQQVTGDIRGQQGATGAQGPAGADGTDGVDGVDGKPVLWYNQTGLLPNQAAFNTLLTESSHSFSKAYFSRVGDVGDEFIYFVTIMDSSTSFALVYRIAAWPEGVNSCTAVYQNVYASMTGRKGDTGATGKDALVYGETIPFSRGESSTQLIEQNLPFANFNRTPELNEDFIAILHDTLTLKDYIANVEVQTINSGSQVVSACVASNIALITGADGQNGTNGTNGKDALVYGAVLTGTFTPNVNDSHGGLENNKMNRTPVVNDVCVVPYRNTSNNKTYLMTCKITLIFSSDCNYTITGVSETTGAAGSAPTLYQHAAYAVATVGDLVCNIVINFISSSNISLTSSTIGSIPNLSSSNSGGIGVNGTVYDTVNQKTYYAMYGFSYNGFRIYYADATSATVTTTNVVIPTSTIISADRVRQIS